MFPKQAVGSVVGIGGMAGAIGGKIIANAVGLILENTKSAQFPNGNNFLIFLIAGGAYLLALVFIHLLAPRLEPAPIKA